MKYCNRALAALFVGIAIVPGAAHAQDSGWTIDPSLDVAVRAVTANFDLRDDDAPINGDAIAVLVSPSVTAENGALSLRLRNSTYRIEYLEDDFLDRWRSVTGAEIAYATDANGSVGAFVEYGDNLSTAESPRTDQWQYGAELERRFGTEHRVRLQGSWRERDYDDLAGSEGSGPRLNGEYRYRFAANHYLYLRGSAEDIDSDTARRNFDRQAVSIAYQRPLARDFRIRPEVRYRHTDFTGRLLPDGDFRSDDVVIPELTLLYSPGDWLFSLEGRYLLRNSTDPEFDRNGYRVSLEARYEF